jgi:hypothetical protein
LRAQATDVGVNLLTLDIVLCTINLVVPLGLLAHFLYTLRQQNLEVRAPAGIIDPRIANNFALFTSRLLSQSAPCLAQANKGSKAGSDAMDKYTGEDGVKQKDGSTVFANPVQEVNDA